MNISDSECEPEGWGNTTSGYFKIRNEECSDSDSDTDSESGTETSVSGTDSEIDPAEVGKKLRGYMKPKYYKKILIEEELLPD